MAIPKEKLPEIVERIRNGSSLGQEAKSLGMSYRTTLITALRAHMGREAYDALIDAKRPRSKGGVLLASIDRPRPDDAGLPVVHSMGKSEGWSWRYVTEHELRAVTVPIKDSKGKVVNNVVCQDGGERILIVIDPHGVEFVRADENEKADLLRAIQHDGPRMRLALWESSACKKRVDRAHHQGNELVERGTAAKKAKRAKAKATPEEVQQSQQAAMVKSTKKKGKATAAHTKKVAPSKKKPVKGKGKK